MSVTAHRPDPLADLEVKAGKVARRLPGVPTGRVVKTAGGRSWNPSLHPRDAKGRFIETGGIARIGVSGKTGRVVRVKGRNRVELELAGGRHRDFDARQLTMLKRPDGSKPVKDSGKPDEKVAEADEKRTASPKRGDGVAKRDDGDRDGDGVPDEVDADPDDPQVAEKVLPRRRRPRADGRPRQGEDEPDDEDGGDDDETERFGPSAFTRFRGGVVMLDPKDDQDPEVAGRVERDPQRPGKFRAVAEDGTVLAGRNGTDTGAVAALAEYRNGGDAPAWEAPKQRAGLRAPTPDPDATPGRGDGRQDGADSPDLGQRVRANRAGASDADLADLAGDESASEQDRALARSLIKRREVAAGQAERGGGKRGDAARLRDGDRYNLETGQLTRADGNDDDGGLGDVRSRREADGDDALTDADLDVLREGSGATPEERKFARDEDKRRRADGDAQPAPAPQREERDQAPVDPDSSDSPERVDRQIAAVLQRAEERGRQDGDPYGEADGITLDQATDRSTARPGPMRDGLERAVDAGTVQASGEGPARKYRRADPDAPSRAERDAAPGDARPTVAPARSERDASDTAAVADALRANTDPDSDNGLSLADVRRATGLDAPRAAAALERAVADGDAKPEGKPGARQKWARSGTETADRGQISDSSTSRDGDSDGSDGLRPDGGAVLADAPAQRVRPDGTDGQGGVLRQPGRAGDGRGADSDGGEPRRVEGRTAEPGDGGAPRDDGQAPRGAGGAGRAGVPAGRAGDAGRGDAGQRGRGAASSAGRDDRPVAPPRFDPIGQGDLQPSGEAAKVAANMDALRTLRRVQAEGRPATREEQATLARWSGWGALPKVFVTGDPKYAAERDDLHELLDDAEYERALQNTLNAHYTDATIIDAMWEGLRKMGFAGGDVLEPGVGAGNFIGRGPRDARVTGVDVDPTTSGIAALLYPDATIRNEDFGTTKITDGMFDAVIGNVPFGNFAVRDATHNPKNGMKIHDHFIAKSLVGLKPGGMMAVVTSAGTLNKDNTEARRRMYEQADLVGAVRLPSGAHKAAAGTDVVTDVLVFRKRKPGEAKGDDSWLKASPAFDAAGQPIMGIPRGGAARQQTTNDYFAARPEKVLGVPEGGGYNGMTVRGDLTSLPAALSDALGEIAQEVRTSGRIYDPQEVAKPLSTPKRRAPAKPRAAKVAATGDAPAIFTPPSSATVARRRDVGQITHTGTERVAGKKEGSEGSLVHTFSQIDVDGEEVVYDAPGAKSAGSATKKTQADELVALLRLRDVRADLTEAETNSATDTPQIKALRAEMGRVYDAYVARFGPVSRVNVTESPAPTPEDVDDPPEGVYQIDEDQWVKRNTNRPGLGGIRRDPSWWNVMGLESDYDETTNTATKADVFARRQIGFRALPTTAQGPDDAMTISMERDGRIDMPRIAKLLGVGEEEARAALGSRVFNDHATGDLVSRRLYLSGNVRRKLAEAREAAESDPSLQRNVDALVDALPADKDPTLITAKLGMAWIGEKDYQAFVAHLTNNRESRVDKDDAGKWRTSRGYGYGNAALEGGKDLQPPEGHTPGDPVLARWGTRRRSTYDLVQTALRQGRATVEDDAPGGDGKIINLKETEAANAKIDAIQREFAKWAWRDEDRSARLHKAYNEKYRSHTDVNYVDSPERLYPGMNDAIVLDPHQNDAVTMALEQPSVLLHHEVGVGKSFTMDAAIMEKRRLGQVNKPAMVVPNHLLEQTVREFKMLYPNARILAADSATLKGTATDPSAGRRRFVAQASSGDWDAVIYTKTAFASIPLSMKRQAAIDELKLDDLRDKRDMQLANGNTAAVKKIGAEIEALSAKIKEQRDRLKKDKGLDFEGIGHDYVVVDEAHEYKNDLVESSIKGLEKKKANLQAVDLREKLDYLREANAKTGKTSVAMFATGTPVSNSTREFYVMARFMRPDLLREAGVEDFDAFAAQYLEMAESIEQNVAGRLQVKMREGDGLINAGELKRLMVQFSDEVTAEDVGIERPRLRGGAAEKVVRPASENLRLFMRYLGKRRDDLRPSFKPEPGDDTAVAIGTDGLTAAVDLRLIPDNKLRDAGIDPASLTDDDSKVTSVGDAILQEWRATKDQAFTVSKSNKTASDVTGGLQIVFADRGVPGGGATGHSFYEAMKDYLVAGGLAPEEVAFIHDADGDPVKMGKLTERARNGEIKVLIGSSPKMGTGLNVQNRATKLHHVDGSYRPDIIEQRNGRVVRRGNQNGEVSLAYYPVAGSNEGFQWAHTSRKDNFLRQYAKADLDATIVGRSDGETASESDLFAALAAEEPLLLDKVRVEKAYNTAFNDLDSQQGSLEYHRGNVTRGENVIARLDEQATAIDRAQERVVSTAGEAFRFTPEGRYGETGDTTGKRDRAAQLIATRLEPMLRYIGQGEGAPFVVGRLGGLNVVARTRSTGNESPKVEFVLEGDPRTPGQRGGLQLLGVEPVIIEAGFTPDRNTITRLENLVASLPKASATKRALSKTRREEVAVSREEAARPLEGKEEFEALRGRREALAEVLRDAAKIKEGGPATKEGPALAEAYKQATAKWEALRDARLGQDAAVRPAEMGAVRTSRRKFKQEAAAQARLDQERDDAGQPRVRLQDASTDELGQARTSAGSARGASRRARPAADPAPDSGGDAQEITPQSVAATRADLEGDAPSAPDAPDADRADAPEGPDAPEGRRADADAPEGDADAPDDAPEAREAPEADADPEASAAAEVAEAPATPTPTPEEVLAEPNPLGAPQDDAAAVTLDPAEVAATREDLAAPTVESDAPTTERAPRAPRQPRAPRDADETPQPAPDAPEEQDDAPAPPDAPATPDGPRFATGEDSPAAVRDEEPLSEADQARIRNAVADHAGQYTTAATGNDPGRYTAEGHLADLVAKRGLTAVADAVRAEIDANPDAMESDPAKRAANTAARKKRVDDVIAVVPERFKAGDFDAVDAALAEAESIDPDYRLTQGGRSMSLDGMRAALAPQRAAVEAERAKVAGALNSQDAPDAPGEGSVPSGDAPDAPDVPDVPPVPDAPATPAAPTPAAPKPARARKPRAGEAMTFHEEYGDVSKEQIASYKRHNVPPATHDELTDYYEDDRAALTAAVRDPENHSSPSERNAKGKMVYGAFSSTKWRDRLEAEQYDAEAGPQSEGNPFRPVNDRRPVTTAADAATRDEAAPATSTPDLTPNVRDLDDEDAPDVDDEDGPDLDDEDGPDAPDAAPASPPLDDSFDYDAWKTTVAEMSDEQLATTQEEFRQTARGLDPASDEWAAVRRRATVAAREGEKRQRVVLADGPASGDKRDTPPRPTDPTGVRRDVVEGITDTTPGYEQGRDLLGDVPAWRAEKDTRLGNLQVIGTGPSRRAIGRDKTGVGGVAVYQRTDDDLNWQRTSVASNQTVAKGATEGRWVNARNAASAEARFPDAATIPEGEWVDRDGARAYRSGTVVAVMHPEFNGKVDGSDWWKGSAFDTVTGNRSQELSFRGWEETPEVEWPRSSGSARQIADLVDATANRPDVPAGPDAEQADAPNAPDAPTPDVPDVAEDLTALDADTLAARLDAAVRDLNAATPPASDDLTDRVLALAGEADRRDGLPNPDEPDAPTTSEATQDAVPTVGGVQTQIDGGTRDLTDDDGFLQSPQGPVAREPEAPTQSGADLFAGTDVDAPQREAPRRPAAGGRAIPTAAGSLFDGETDTTPLAAPEREAADVAQASGKTPTVTDRAVPDSPVLDQAHAANEDAPAPARPSAPAADAPRAVPDGPQDAPTVPTGPQDATGQGPVALAGEKFAPTVQQQGVYDAIAARSDVVVRAKAGSGKTTTLEGAARRIAADRPGDRVAYIAFNKSVQTEALRRMPGNVEPRTGHSVAFAWAPDPLKARTKDESALRRPDEIARHLRLEPVAVPGRPALTPSEVAMAALETVDSWSNSAEKRPGREHLPGRIAEMPEEVQDAIVKAAAEKVWPDLTREEGGRLRLSLDHLRKQWALSEPDFTKDGSGLQRPATVLFLDEAQDTPPVLAAVIAAHKGRMQRVIVGDQDQAIYGFTGATDYLDKADGDVDLPLTTSWRFGPQIAEIGNRFLQLLDSPERVRGGGAPSKVTEPGTMTGADAILARTNSGMIAEIAREQEAGRLVGVPKGTKAELRSLVATARYLKGEGRAPERMHDDLAAYRTWDEVRRAAEGGDSPAARTLHNLVEDTGLDRLDAIVSDTIDEGDAPLADVAFIDAPHGLYADGSGTFASKDALKAAGFTYRELPGAGNDSKGRAIKKWTVAGTPEQRDAAMDALRTATAGPEPDVTVSTAHKAKGLEWDRVRIGDDFRGPDAETGEMPDPEELRLAYVAVTRGRREVDAGSLAWVEGYTTANGKGPRPDAPAAPNTPDAPREQDAPTPARTERPETPDPEQNPDVYGDGDYRPGDPLYDTPEEEAAAAPRPAPATPAPQATPAPAAPPRPAPTGPVPAGQGVGRKPAVLRDGETYSFETGRVTRADGTEVDPEAETLSDVRARRDALGDEGLTEGDLDVLRESAGTTPDEQRAARAEARRREQDPERGPKPGPESTGRDVADALDDPDREREAFEEMDRRDAERAAATESARETREKDREQERDLDSAVEDAQADDDAASDDLPDDEPDDLPDADTSTPPASPADPNGDPADVPRDRGAAEAARRKYERARRRRGELEQRRREEVRRDVEDREESERDRDSEDPDVRERRDAERAARLEERSEQDERREAEDARLREERQRDRDGRRGEPDGDGDEDDDSEEARRARKARRSRKRRKRQGLRALRKANNGDLNGLNGLDGLGLPDGLPRLPKGKDDPAGSGGSGSGGSGSGAGSGARSGARSGAGSAPKGSTPRGDGPERGDGPPAGSDADGTSPDAGGQQRDGAPAGDTSTGTGDDSTGGGTGTGTGDGSSRDGSGNSGDGTDGAPGSTGSDSQTTAASSADQEDPDLGVPEDFGDDDPAALPDGFGDLDADEASATDATSANRRPNLTTLDRADLGAYLRGVEDPDEIDAVLDELYERGGGDQAAAAEIEGLSPLDAALLEGRVDDALDALGGALNVDVPEYLLDAVTPGGRKPSRAALSDLLADRNRDLLGALLERLGRTPDGSGSTQPVLYGRTPEDIGDELGGGSALDTLLRGRGVPAYLVAKNMPEETTLALFGRRPDEIARGRAAQFERMYVPGLEREGNWFDDADRTFDAAREQPLADLAAYERARQAAAEAGQARRDALDGSAGRADVAVPASAVRPGDAVRLPAGPGESDRDMPAGGYLGQPGEADGPPLGAAREVLGVEPDPDSGGTFLTLSGRDGGQPEVALIEDPVALSRASLTPDADLDADPGAPVGAGGRFAPGAPAAPGASGVLEPTGDPRLLRPALGGAYTPMQLDALVAAGTPAVVSLDGRERTGLVGFDPDSGTYDVGGLSFTPDAVRQVAVVSGTTPVPGPAVGRSLIAPGTRVAVDTPDGPIEGVLAAVDPNTGAATLTGARPLGRRGGPALPEGTISGDGAYAGPDGARTTGAGREGGTRAPITVGGDGAASVPTSSLLHPLVRQAPAGRTQGNGLRPGEWARSDNGALVATSPGEWRAAVVPTEDGEVFWSASPDGPGAAGAGTVAGTAGSVADAKQAIADAIEDLAPDSGTMPRDRAAGTGGRPQPAGAPSEAPQPIGGRPVEWVSATVLDLGDVARVSGYSWDGTTATGSGFVLGRPAPATAKQADGSDRPLISVTVGEHADGSGARTVIYAPLDAIAARAPQGSGSSDGNTATGAESDVRADRLPAQLPQGVGSRGLFPGTQVSNARSKQRGVVTASRLNDVQVSWEDGKGADVIGENLTVIDGGAARPPGWTDGGRRVVDGLQVTGPLPGGGNAGKASGRVAAVVGDDVTVITPSGPVVLSARTLEVTGLAQADAPGSLQVERAPASQAGVGDTVMVGGPSGRLVPATVTEAGADTVAWRTDTGTPGTTAAADPLDVVTADGKPATVPTTEAVGRVEATGVPASEVQGPTVATGLGEEQRAALGAAGFDLDGISEENVSQAAARLRAGLEPTAEQAVALSAAIRAAAGQDSPQRRTLLNIADALDAAAGADHTPQAAGPVRVADLGVGDEVTLPDGDSGTVVAVHNDPSGSGLSSVDLANPTGPTSRVLDGNDVVNVGERESPDATAGPREVNADEQERAASEHAERLAEEFTTNRVAAARTAIRDLALGGTRGAATLGEAKEKVAERMEAARIGYVLRPVRETLPETANQAGIPQGDRERVAVATGAAVEDEAQRARRAVLDVLNGFTAPRREPIGRTRSRLAEAIRRALDGEGGAPQVDEVQEGPAPDAPRPDADLPPAPDAPEVDPPATDAPGVSAARRVVDDLQAELDGVLPTGPAAAPAVEEALRRVEEIGRRRPAPARVAALARARNGGRAPTRPMLVAAARTLAQAAAAFVRWLVAKLRALLDRDPSTDVRQAARRASRQWRRQGDGTPPPSGVDDVAGMLR